ncbi:MAG: dihydrofolate reductase family protein [Anaerolineales bacterium]|jgi:dihydrofolate reductase
MGTIGAGFSMSLDGFIAGPNDDVQRLFAWMSMGDTDLDLSSGDTDYELKMSSESAEGYEKAIQTTGAIVSGRRMFDVAGAWGGKHPLGVPVVVVTHSVPQEWVYEGSPFTFVTDGVESAIEKAREIAGEKNIGVGGADITRQCLKLGLLDEIQIDLVPVLLGQGVRLFEYLGSEPVELERTGVRESPGVTHLSFRVVK